MITAHEYFILFIFVGAIIYLNYQEQKNIQNISFREIKENYVKNFQRPHNSYFDYLPINLDLPPRTPNYINNDGIIGSHNSSHGSSLTGAAFY